MRDLPRPPAEGTGCVPARFQRPGRSNGREAAGLSSNALMRRRPEARVFQRAPECPGRRKSGPGHFPHHSQKTDAPARAGCLARRFVALLSELPSLRPGASQTMSIPAVCPGCQKTYRVPESAAGKTVLCKKCGGKFKVPAAPEDDDALLDELIDEPDGGREAEDEPSIDIFGSAPAPRRPSRSRPAPAGARPRSASRR